MAKARGKSDGNAAVMEVLGRHGFPSAAGKGLAFTPQGDALYAAGYPHLRLLSDEPVPEAKAVKIAEDALDAIDPALRITVPRAIARAFLAGYRGGTGLFLDDPQKPQNSRLKAERAARMGTEVTIDLLRDTLSERGVSMLDTYARWRWPKVIYLYEAFLGTEPVARALTTHLCREANDLSRWGFAGRDPHRTNATPHYLALALAWLFVRLPPEVVNELRAELLSARAPSDAPGEPRAYLSLLRTLGGDAAADRAPFAFELGLAANDAAAVAAMADAGHNFLQNVGRLSWTLGTARLARALNVSGHDLPRMIDQIAPLRDPGIARLVAAIGSQRAGKEAAAEWLRRHAAYARPILRDLATLADPKEKKNAEAGLALLDDETPVLVKTPTEEEVEQEIATIFRALRQKLLKTKDEEKQKALIRDAHERYTEARAAAGDPIPDAYFIHRFGDFDCGEWAVLAVDAID